MNTVPEIRIPETVDQLERYWTEALIPLVPSAGLAADYARGAAAAPARIEIDVPVPAALSAAVLNACQAKPALVCALLIAAAQALIYRLNGGDQTTVLTPVSAAASGETGTNRWLVAKTATSAADTSAALLDRVRRMLADAYTHQEFPFARVLELLGRPWPANRAPLSDVAVAVAGVSRMDVFADVAADLIVIGRADGAFGLRLAYRPDLFACETVVQFGARIVRVLSSMIESPHRPLGEIALLDPWEEAAALSRSRAREERALPEARVETLIAAVADREPETVGVIHGEDRLTYGELVAQARRLAATLRRAGVQPGDRVAVALDAGVRTAVALLGVWFSGAAFVPIDPRHPAARMQRIAAAANVRVAIVEPRLDAVFASSARVLHTDTVTEDADGAAADDDGLVDAGMVGAGDDRALAYVMFTSGSTGEPKGVAISHRALVNYLLWARDYYGGEERPVFAWYSSIAFDLTLTSIFLPLVAGGTAVVFAFESGVVDMPAIFADSRVNAVKATPSHLKLLRASDLAATRVTRLIVGGEGFDAALAESLRTTMASHCAIYNEYGPTEATIAVMAHRLTGDDGAGATVPLGRPIWNTSVYLLDDDRRPVAAGMPGQIWIAGRALADGYLDDAERTAESFVDDPIAPGRMYATGDRGRYDSAGRLFYLGRRDDQVKFKGVRVELGDVRAALTRVPRVRDAVVRVLEDQHREQIMVACYVARQTLDVSILRAGVMELLAPEMVPNLFVRVAKLPLTLNGKIDVDRLPSLEEARKSASRMFEPPRTATERAVASVWSEILGVPELSVHSNFFELGGHSLLASQVVARLAEQLGVDVPLRSLFEAPTIAQVAVLVDERTAAASAAPAAAAGAER